MSIMTFGSRDMSVRECDLVCVGIELMGSGTRLLSLYAVPVICEPFNCQPVTLCQMSYPHLAGLPLADGLEQLDVSILIGSDQYWSFITDAAKAALLQSTLIWDGYYLDLLVSRLKTLPAPLLLHIPCVLIPSCYRMFRCLMPS